MDEIKAVVSDLDGTLINDRNEFSGNSLKAVRYLERKGILFLPVTGRCYRDMWTVFGGLDIRCPAILLNGAQYRDAGGKVSCAVAMIPDTVGKVLTVMEKWGVGIGLYMGDDMLELRQGVAMGDIFSKAGFPYSNGDAGYNWYGRAAAIDKKEALERDILKIEAMGENREAVEECTRELKGIPDIEVTRSMFHNVEVTHKGVNKAAMTVRVLGAFGIQEREALIFGDSPNDLCLFERFENTVAVENACEEVLKSAKYRCAGCEEDGIAEFIFQHL